MTFNATTSQQGCGQQCSMSSQTDRMCFFRNVNIPHAARNCHPRKPWRRPAAHRSSGTLKTVPAHCACVPGHPRRNLDLVQLMNSLWNSFAVLSKSYGAHTTCPFLEQVLLQVLMRIVEANERQPAPCRQCWWRYLWLSTHQGSPDGL